MDNLVLVTGASGYIATHVVKQLQEAGYRVRGTVRSLENENKVKPLRELCPNAKHPIELVEADLTIPDKWEDAVKDCVYVLHLASPFLLENPKNEDEILKPAVEGTLNVLNACKAVGTVKRVVLTSSVAAIEGGHVGEGKTLTEEDWTDLTNRNVSTYYKSKTLAEKAAWDFINEMGENSKFDLVVMNPAFVVGPVLCGPVCTSAEVILRILEKQMPMVPALTFNIIDVRDVAAAHIKGMTLPEAAGCRHVLATGTPIWMKDMALILDGEFKSQGYSIPTTEAPNCIMKMVSIFDSSLKPIIPVLGKITKIDTTRMKTVLGIEPISAKESLIDMAYSLIESGKARKTRKYRGPKNEEEQSK